MSAKALRAGGTIRRCRFVKASTAADNTVLECDANDRILGISDEAGRTAPIPSVTADPPEAAQANEDVRVFFDGELCQIECGATVTRGDLLESNADGDGIKLTEAAGDKRECGAIALQSGVDKELIAVLVRTQTVTTET